MYYENLALSIFRHLVVLGLYTYSSGIIWLRGWGRRCRRPIQLPVCGSKDTRDLGGHDPDVPEDSHLVVHKIVLLLGGTRMVCGNVSFKFGVK